MTSAGFERALIRAAFLEFCVARAYSTGTTTEVLYRRPPGPLILSPFLSHSWPPKGFRDNELGFGLDSGPSLAWTCRTLDKANRTAVGILGSEAPYRYTWPRKRAQA